MVQAESRNDTRVTPPSHIQVQNAVSSIPHHNDELTNTSASYQFGWANRQLSKASCSQHQVSTNNRTLCAAHFKPPTETYDLAGRYRLEADSCADTLCFGKGWKLDYLTGQQVDVDGFHSSMTTMKNIPIGSAYTAMDHPNGNTYILHAHFGCRDPHTNIHLPFSLYGCISYLPI